MHAHLQNVFSSVMWIRTGCIAGPYLDPESASASIRNWIQMRIRNQGVKSCLKVKKGTPVQS